MDMENKLVFLDGQFPAILFPVGSLESGGTCAWMTNHCQLYCPTRETNYHEKRALDFFRDNDSEIITKKILEDLSDYSLMHLYWWSWGDCPPDLTDKVFDIMVHLSEIGVLQNGYTRNEILWRNINFPQRNNLKIGAHVDDKPGLLVPDYRDKIVCCPDVLVNKAELYYNGVKIARCCGIWCDWVTVKETRAADCQECYLYKQGCFFH